MHRHHAYALTSVGRVMALRALLPLIADDAKTTWIDLAYEGAWEGHASGPFELTRAAFEQILANFEAQRNPVPLDYEHASEWATEAPAAGWIHKLEIRDAPGGARLWAFVELTAKAADQIRCGAYRFSSGVFDFGATDRKTGEPIGCRLRSAALTNQPFLDGQTPIALSQRAALALENQMNYTKKQLLEALDLIKGSDVDMEQLEQVLAGLAAQAGKPAEPEPPEAPDMSDAPALSAPAAPAAPLAEPPPAAPMAAPADADAGAMLLAKLTAALPGMDAAAILAALDAKLDQVASLLKSDATSPGDSATLTDAAQVTIQSLSERLKAFEDREAKRLASEKATAEAARKVALTARVDALINGGRLLSAGRDKMIALAVRDESAFADLESSLATTPPLGAHASATTSIALDDSKPETVADDDPAIKPVVATLKGARDEHGKLLSADGQVALAKRLIAQRRADERRQARA
jgi:hypothetical protein